MPIYEYVCGDCREVFEEIVKGGDDKVECPKCGGACERIPSAPSPLKTGAFPFKAAPPRPAVKPKP